MHSPDNHRLGDDAAQHDHHDDCHEGDDYHHCDTNADGHGHLGRRLRRQRLRRR